MPFALVPFLLLVVPAVEIAAFIAIGGQIGIGWTLAMILVTAIIGSFLLRQQGLQLFQRVQNEMNAGQIPGQALGESAMILVAGILLLTPGFVTDGIGFLLFVPPIRLAIWSAVASRINLRSATSFSQSNYDSTHNDTRYQSDEPGPVIDLDEDDYSTGEENTNSPWRKD